MISIMASCAWDGTTTNGTVFQNQLLEGKPHDTVACHGYAKRNVYLASKYYKQQYNLPSETVCFTTLYGPHDSFDPDRTKVVGSLINKIYQAKITGNPPKLWGNGYAKRQLLYIDDAVDILLNNIFNKTVFNEFSIFPFMVGSPYEVTIRDLASLIAQIIEYDGPIEWDETKPNGQKGKFVISDKCLDNYKFTTLEDGLRKTIHFYKSSQSVSRAIDLAILYKYTLDPL
jgi:GDP-L-fucose synthase